ncbi:alpha/beta-hydrolase [Pleomassaria siparia CBS 279.74]|uniref:Alpha/beta-hydrolase n=1 Tax=Pleomassaria siparia CBS 279.74 TaxID=1314801 RepID=A0A6G1KGV6_9PLEO|nr:alpha/beta-hydrolase [Pleomassaria siparia CBS 279.74]
MPFFDTPDSLPPSLFYTLSGSSNNTSILIIHGWTADSHDWSWQISFLVETHHVIAMDLRGHGKSAAPKGVSYTPQTQAKDAAALLRHLKYEKDIVVMGHSMGSVTASALAVQEPDLIKAIVLVDPPYWAPAAIHVIRDCLGGLYDEGNLGRESVNLAFVEEKRKCPRLAVYAKGEDCDKERALGMGPLDEVASIEGQGHWIMQMKSEEFNEMLGGWLGNLGKS